MAEYQHPAASEQHIRLLHQSNSQAHPPRLQHQSPTALDHNPWAAEAALEAYLRQQKWLQDSAANPPL